MEVWYLLKEILFGAGGVSFVSLGILSVHWNIREVVAYKTGLGKKVRVVKAGSEQEEVKYRSNTLRPLGKVKFAEAALEEGKVEEASKKLEVAKEESYIYTQAVVGDIGDAIDDMLEQQKGSLGQGIVPEVEEDILENVDVEVYEGTQVLTVDDGHTTVLVDEELEEVELTPTEHTQVLVEQEEVQEEVQTPLEHTQVLVENQEEVKEDKNDNDSYFTEVLEQEPEMLENEVNYGTDILVSEHEGDISDEESNYLTEVLVEDEEIDVAEVDVVEEDLTDNDFEYITKVMVETEDSEGSDEDYTTTVLVNEVEDTSVAEEVTEDVAYETQVLVDEVDYHTTVLVEEEPDYNTMVLVEDEPDYNTTVLVAEEDYNTTVLDGEEDEYHTVAFEDDGITGNVVGESVESAKTVGVEDIKVIYTNYELEEK